MSGDAALTVAQVVATVAIGPNEGVLIPPGQTAELTAEAVDPGGTRVEDRSITWESSDEQIVEVSPTGVVTGIAYGAADVFATTDGVVGSRLIAVSDPVPIEACKIKNTILLNSGFEPESHATDLRVLFRPTGAIRSVVLYVDFPDFPGSGDIQALFDAQFPPALAWFNEVSNGRMVNTVTHTPNWIRMPKPTSAYPPGWKLVQDAVLAADPFVDFREVDLVHVVVTENSVFSVTSGWHLIEGDCTDCFPQDKGIPVDGVEVRHGTSFGGGLFDGYAEAPWDPANTLIHEIGHTFGLPDLLDRSKEDWWEAHSPVGGWDPMSENFLAPSQHYLVWHKWKVGWVLDEDVDCITFGEFERTVFTFEQRNELQAIVIPTSETTAYVIEARKRIGFDERICQEGVLVYTVDANVTNGDGPIRVQLAQPDIRYQCDPANRATFGVGQERVSTFQDPAIGLTVEVLEDLGTGYRVRIRKEP